MISFLLRFPRSLLFIFLSFLFLSSCVRGIQPPPKSGVSQNVNLSDKEKEAYETGVFTKGLWPEDHWWEMFCDKELAALIETAIKESPTLQHAESRVAQANQEAFIARSKLFPSLSALFNFFWAYFSKDILKALGLAINPNFHMFNLLLDFDYELDFWGKNRRLFEIALGEAKVQEAMNAEARLILSISIAKEYFNLQANIARNEVMEEILKNRQKSLDLLNMRKIHRIDNLIDLNGMKEEITQIQKTLVALNEEILLGKSLIATLVGQNPDTKFDIKPIWKLEKKRVELPQNIGLNLLMRRPDLAAQVWRVQKASKYVGVAVANFFPNIDLKAFGGSQSIQFNQLFQGNALTGGALPYIKLPIFEGGRLRAYLKAKVAEYEGAVYEYNSLLLKAANEVVSNITKVSSITEKLKYQDDNIHFTKQNYDLVYTRYRHGVDSMISVLKSNEKFLLAKFEEIELQKLRYHTILSLVRSLGGGFIDESVPKGVMH